VTYAVGDAPQNCLTGQSRCRAVDWLVQRRIGKPARPVGRRREEAPNMPLNKRVIRAPRPEVPPQEKGPVFNGTPEAVLLKTNNLQLSRGTPGGPLGRALRAAAVR